MSVKWKPYIAYSIEGKPFTSDATAFNEDQSLLNRILQMPKKDKTISVYAAYSLYWDDIVSNLVEIGDSSVAGLITEQDWVSWTSKAGFQIVLTGTEFETCPRTV